MISDYHMNRTELTGKNLELLILNRSQEYGGGENNYLGIVKNQKIA